MKKIDVAVIGLGRMGETHVEAAKESPYVGTIYGYEPATERRMQRSRELNVVPATLEEIWGNPAVKLVYIASTNETHAALATSALKNGKAVMCEKPMGQNLAEAKKLIEVAEETGGFLQIGFELHYSKLYQKTKSWLDQGLIGDVVNIQCRYFCCEFHNKNTWRSNSTGSFLIGEKLSHYLDLERWWFGASPESVYSVSAPKVVPYFNHRDNHQMIMKFPGQRIGTLNFIMYIAETLHHDPLIEPLEKQSDDGHFLQYHICGTHGAIENDVFRRRLRRWQFTDGPTCQESNIVESINYPPTEDNLWIHNTHGQNLRIAELVAKNLPPEVPARDAYETMKLCFAAEKSEDEGRIIRLDDLESEFVGAPHQESVSVLQERGHRTHEAVLAE
jgi:predicted dehydrogenase